MHYIHRWDPILPGHGHVYNERYCTHGHRGIMCSTCLPNWYYSVDDYACIDCAREAQVISRGVHYHRFHDSQRLPASPSDSRRLQPFPTPAVCVS